MNGVITTRDVLNNLGLIWREFGPGCFFRCIGVLARGKKTTFLEVAMKDCCVKASVGADRN